MNYINNVTIKENETRNLRGSRDKMGSWEELKGRQGN